MNQFKEAMLSHQLDVIPVNDHWEIGDHSHLPEENPTIVKLIVKNQSETGATVELETNKPQQTQQKKPRYLNFKRTRRH